ncbi:MAG: phage portal protein [Hyphomonadaceae bacterium]|nr:phage portal protein [Hyphomonadaceae bacterium]
MIREAFQRWLGIEQRSYDALAPGNWGRPVPQSAFAAPGAVLSNLAVAARCVSLRSELLASVPLKLYRRLPNGDRERVTDSPLADVLGDLSNPLQTAFETRELFVRSLDLRGNAFARIERDGAGQVVALWPLEATRVTVERLENGRLRYRHTTDRGPVVLLQEEVLHIRASSEDGLLGRSPIEIARGVLGYGLELHNAAHDASSRKQGGYIIQPGETNPRSKRQKAEALDEQTDGLSRFAPRILDPGVKFIPTTFSAADAELLESKKLSNEDTARIFGVPPASVGISQSVSYGSVQQAAQDLVTNALAPLAQRVEQALARCLLTTEGRRTLIIEHELAGLLRGDASARWAAYKTGREIGALSAGEIRRFENLGPFDPTDDYTPLRTTPMPNDPIASAKQ